MNTSNNKQHRWLLDDEGVYQNLWKFLDPNKEFPDKERFKKVQDD